MLRAHQFRSCFLPMIVAGMLASGASANAASFTYRGQLDDRGVAANGHYDLRLSPWLDPSRPIPAAAPMTFPDVQVIDGRFTLAFDLPVGSGQAVWLDLEVADVGSAQFTPIPGRIEATAAPLVGACWSSTGDAGTNPNLNFLGTTDGEPLVLRSSAGVAINTNSARDMLTLRGGDSFTSGPTIQMLGIGPDQAESGRIRFVEGTASGNLRGAYLRYDGAANLLALGAHNSSDSLPAGQVDHLVVRRTATTQVGIGTVPTTTLDVAGDIRLDGGLHYANVQTHFRNLTGHRFSEFETIDCAIDGSGRLFRSGFALLGFCTAFAEADFPLGARLTELSVAFLDTGSADCDLDIRRLRLSPNVAQTDLARIVSNNNSSSVIERSVPLNSIVQANDVFRLRFDSPSNECKLVYVRIAYELPNGFIP